MVVFKVYHHNIDINYLIPYLVPASRIDNVHISKSKRLDSDYSMYFSIGDDSFEISKIDIKNPTLLDTVAIYLSYPDSASVVVTISPTGAISSDK